ncbi:uncharacterized protein LOC115875313 [Sitophilus oryzae]|uniref:Uncharacterized protein LOC115875313 n=1 Tax=Sitophilus oryzae TaxID=7048 RepID=A0A6J2X5Z3_SITOR|nr:uncharacterized protein LOC115875313 [Sitophilus oryzae]
MYPMVQRQRDQQHQKPNQTRNRAGLLEQQPTVSVISRGRFQQHDVLEPLQEVSVAQQELTDDDEEEQRLPKRPLHRRFFTYVREAWTGVKSALGYTLYDRKRTKEIRKTCKIWDVARWTRNRRREWRDHVDEQYKTAPKNNRNTNTYKIILQLQDIPYMTGRELKK